MESGQLFGDNWHRNNSGGRTGFSNCGGCKSATATTLELPEVCLRSKVNSTKKER
jgi:hypothetical protein